MPKGTPKSAMCWATILMPACSPTSDKKSIQALNRYQIEQGLVKKEMPLESLFVKEAFRM